MTYSPPVDTRSTVPKERKIVKLSEARELAQHRARDNNGHAVAICWNGHSGEYTVAYASERPKDVIEWVYR